MRYNYVVLSFLVWHCIPFRGLQGFTSPSQVALSSWRPDFAELRYGAVACLSQNEYQRPVVVSKRPRPCQYAVLGWSLKPLFPIVRRVHEGYGFLSTVNVALLDTHTPISLSWEIASYSE